MSNTKELSMFNKKNNKETITPHRLTVAVLIQEFFKFRKSLTFQILPEDNKNQKYIRDFCVLLCKLILSPDLTLDELTHLLTIGKYTIHTELIQCFNFTLSELNAKGIGYLLDVVGVIDKLIVKEADTALNRSAVQMNKNSITGYYLRRLLVNFDKLSFSEVTAVLQAYKRYYSGTQKSIRSNLKDLHLPGPEKISFKEEDWYSDKDQWSRRQAELFIASQAALLSNNEEKALKPNELQKHIKNLLKSNPDLAEAHFLNYLNYLRVNEFCGAIDSLYHCFDRNTVMEGKGINDEKTMGYRFAALNLAVLHYHFGHVDEALAALKEAIMLAQEASDNICLQHALSWLYCLTNTNKEKLLEHSILKSLELNLPYTTSLSIQSFVQYAGITGGHPKQIFETITNSDIVNCQHMFGELISSSYAQKSALWLFYGKTQMSSLWSQLLLHLHSENLTTGRTYCGEAMCHVICNIADHLLLQGQYALSHTILKLAKERFPNEPVSHTWMLCENLFTFVRALHNEEWTIAEAAAQKMAVLNKWESRLRITELLLHKQDYVGAHKCVSEVLKNWNDAKNKLRTDYRIRAMVLLAQIQCASSFPNSAPPGILALLYSSLAYANDYHVDYYAAIVHLHLANVQLLLGMPAQALKLLDRSLIQILSHGGNFDRARAILLYVKCIVANSTHKPEAERHKIVTDAAMMLDKTRYDFQKVEAFSREKDVLYLQAVLYNEVNLKDQRNQCALEYRLLDEDHPSKNNYKLLTFL